jgi:hypothetical protein
VAAPIAGDEGKDDGRDEEPLLASITSSAASLITEPYVSADGRGSDTGIFSCMRVRVDTKEGLPPLASLRGAVLPLEVLPVTGLALAKTGVIGRNCGLVC